MKEEWDCTRCSVSYFPYKGEKVKRTNKFTTPGPETDSHGNIIEDIMPLVSVVHDKKKMGEKCSLLNISKKLQSLIVQLEDKRIR
jgi:hypothetical protein